MRLRRIRGAALVLVLVLVLVVGCGRGETDAGSPGADASRVGELLYAENLIADPEVNAEVGRYITAVDRDGVRADSVLPELRAWLEEWVARHPDRASRARLLPRGPSHAPAASPLP